MEKLEKKMKESMDSAVQMAEKMMEENPSMSMDEAIAKALTVLADKKNKSIEAKARKDMSVSRDRLRKLVQVAYDYQDLRIRTANRLSRKADGTDQDKDDAILPEQEIPQIIKVLERSQSMEKSIFDDIDREVKKFPIYTEFLSKVKGCGPAMSAILISCIDIHKADTAAKITQYAGLNPGMVRGKKKDKDGNIVTTDDMVRGDRPTKGYILPYNAFLKTKLMGVLATCFIKCGSQYRYYYDARKNRLMSSELPVNGNDEKKWKDETKAHINMAAQRYMMKMFLQDLYGVWRKLEGLPVREPYQKEYLGHETTMPSIADEIMGVKEEE